MAKFAQHRRASRSHEGFRAVARIAADANWHCQKFHAAASDRVSKTHNKTRNKKIIKSTMASRVHHFKLVLLGDTAVGKSCLVVRFVRDEFFEFQEPTIGGKKNRKGRHDVPVQKGATAGLTRSVSSRGKLRKFYVRSRPQHKREKFFSQSRKNFAVPRGLLIPFRWICIRRFETIWHYRGGCASFCSICAFR